MAAIYREISVKPVTGKRACMRQFCQALIYLYNRNTDLYRSSIVRKDVILEIFGCSYYSNL